MRALPGPLTVQWPGEGSRAIQHIETTLSPCCPCCYLLGSMAGRRQLPVVGGCPTKGWDMHTQTAGPWPVRHMEPRTKSSLLGQGWCSQRRQPWGNTTGCGMMGRAWDGRESTPPAAPGPSLQQRRANSISWQAQHCHGNRQDLPAGQASTDVAVACSTGRRWQAGAGDIRGQA